MTLKYQLLGLLAVGIGGFAAGHFLLPSKIVRTKTVVVYRERQDTSVIHTTTTKKPDGSSVTVTEVAKHVTTDTHSTAAAKEVTTYDTAKLRVAVIAASTLSNSFLSPSYGVHVSYQVLGPIEIGALGLSNGLFGLSLGIRF